jgi:hypothetical protein
MEAHLHSLRGADNHDRKLTSFPRSKKAYKNQITQKGTENINSVTSIPQPVSAVQIS